ncbi:MAG: prepilin peptidase [Planctomycetota bacterium]|nr:prepilin peptidase [Planctomycetota bacterium]
MPQFDDFGTALAHNWPFWLVSVVLVVAAVIDGVKLKVPNWITFALVISGWIYSPLAFGWEGLMWSLGGTLLGLALLLPAYAIGGMGAGDVKLLAGVGAWVHPTHTMYAFCATAIIGAVIAVIQAWWLGGLRKHASQFQSMFYEILIIRNPSQLAAIAADRKSTMLLLPYGIPMTIGTIVYFAWTGMLV